MRLIENGLNKALLAISGPGSTELLQGQTSVNMNALKPGIAALGAACDIKGRVVANFKIVALAERDYRLSMCSESLDLLLDSWKKVLPFYRGIQMSRLDWHRYAGADQTTDNQSVQFPMDGLTYLEQWSPTPQEGSISLQDFDHFELVSGLLWIDHDQSAKHTPQAINWTKVDGISFNKGCYTGQEVIARLHYKGQSKKSLYFATLDEPPTDNQVLQLEKKIGEVLVMMPQQQQWTAVALLNAELPQLDAQIEDKTAQWQNFTYNWKKTNN